MTLRTTLGNAVKPVLRNLNRELGDLVRFYRPSQASAADNSPVFTYPAVNGLQDVYATLSAIDFAAAQKLWGQETEATLVGYVTEDTAPLENDIVVPQAGPWAGSKYRVKHRKPDGMSNTYRLGLVLVQPDENVQVG